MSDYQVTLQAFETRESKIKCTLAIIRQEKKELQNKLDDVVKKFDAVMESIAMQYV